MIDIKEFLNSKKEKTAYNFKKKDDGYNFTANDIIKRLRADGLFVENNLDTNDKTEKIMYISFSRIPKYKSSVIICNSEFLDNNESSIDSELVLFVIADKETKKYPCIVVYDVEKAYHSVCSVYRDQFDARYIAITGSVGKTTNTQMIYQTLSSYTDCLTISNNSLHPICEGLNLLTNKTRFFVQECAEASPGIPSIISSIIKPYVVAFTNVESVHQDNFDSFGDLSDNVFSLVNRMDKNGYVVVNADDEALGSKEFEAKKITVSLQKKDSDYYAENVRTDGVYIEFDVIRLSDGIKRHLELQVPGIHNVYNAMISIAVFDILGVPSSLYLKKLNKYKASGIRQNMIKHKNGFVFADCFNASFRATMGAVDIFDKLDIRPRFKKIAVLGFEEGITDAMPLAKKIKDSSIDVVITYGDVAELIYDAAVQLGQEIYHAETFDSLVALVERYYCKGDSILFKGNRALELDKVIKRVFPSVYRKTRISSAINLYRS